VESPHSTEAPTRARSCAGARIIAIFTAVAAAVALTPAAPGIAATGTTAPATREAAASPATAREAAARQAADRLAAAAGSVNLTAAPEAPANELARLERRAKALAKEFRGEVINLTEARAAARRATARANGVNTDLARTRARVAQLAARSYMAGGVDQMPLAFSTDPQSLIDNLGLQEYLARQNGARAEKLASLTAEANQAMKTARNKVDEVSKIVADLEKQRARVSKLVKKFKAERAKRAKKAAAASASGSVPLRAKSPLTGNFMTDRMRRFYLEVDSRFGPFKSVGCHRPGDPQDHGTGRACDFMVSFGTMPSASGAAQCDRASQFAIDNASRLGLKYVIWKQRIYDVRNPGWRQMEDRGSITQNHFDHCHISVF
jgi:hypothetical protein